MPRYHTALRRRRFRLRAGGLDGRLRASIWKPPSIGVRARKKTLQITTNWLTGGKHLRVLQDAASYISGQAFFDMSAQAPATSNPVEAMALIAAW